MTTNDLGLYIHIPFCAGKCAYCDFLSFAGADESLVEAYGKALLQEIAYRGEAVSGIRASAGESGVREERMGAQAGGSGNGTREKVDYNRFTVDTIFIGGGTPSLLSADFIKEILAAVRRSFPVKRGAEITIEANPGTLTAEKLRSYLAAGINRISLGAQSFDEKLLETLGRRHSADDIVKTAGMMRRLGADNINLDLMFAIPGQTPDSWHHTLRQAIALEPAHISFYGLQIEDNTPLSDRLRQGVVEPVSDESYVQLYRLAVAALEDAGYEQYEISNAAKKGYACRHNLKYWSIDAYLGLGLGAHSFWNGKRFSNQTDLVQYNRAATEQPYRAPVASCTENTVQDDMAEYLFTGLRKRSGIRLSDFERRFQRPIREVYRKEWPAVERFIGAGLLILDGDALKLSLDGIPVSNKILSVFVNDG